MQDFRISKATIIFIDQYRSRLLS